MRIIFLFLVFLVQLSSQIPIKYSYKPNQIPVTGKSGNYQIPFSGGIDNPRFQFVDIDDDKDLDLFFIDRDEVLQFYNCTQLQKYELQPNVNFGIKTVNWVRFVDIDADGDLDCFGNNLTLGLTLNKNIGTKSAPNFELASSEIKDSLNNPVAAEFYAVPYFADIDGDNDYDILTGTSNGQVTFYQNIGTSTNYKYKYVTDYWQQLNIQGTGIQKNNSKQSRHGSSVLEFFDSDSNGTLDLFWGDMFNSSLYFLKNIGTKTEPKLVLSDSTYPKEAPIKTAGFNMTQHIDFDGDKKIDLIIGSLFFTQTTKSFLFYKNIGTNKTPFYKIESENLFPTIDVGSRSFPTVCDVDLDGDNDLLIGSDNGNIALLKNLGSNDNPEYLDNDNVVTSISSSYYLTPTAGDLNGDGKPDLLVGDFSGGIRFLKNISTGSNILFSLEAFMLDTIDVGNNSAPYLADVTGDTLLDLFIGTSSGKIIFLKNIGTKVNPKFQIVQNVSDSINVGFDATPAVIIYDGKPHLVSGSGDGKIYCFVNIGTKSSPKFQKNPTSSFNISTSNIKLNSAPAFYVKNNSAVPDLYVGNGKGGLFYFTGSIYLGVAKTNPPKSFELYQNYPNPFNNSTIISFNLQTSGFVAIKIFDLLGNEIETILNEFKNAGKQNVFFNSKNLASGVYYYSVYINTLYVQKVQTGKMILIK